MEAKILNLFDPLLCQPLLERGAAIGFRPLYRPLFSGREAGVGEGHPPFPSALAVKFPKPRTLIYDSGKRPVLVIRTKTGYA